MKCILFVHQDIQLVFLTNTPMFEVEERKLCNPLIISSAEAHCWLFRFLQVYYSAINSDWQMWLSYTKAYCTWQLCLLYRMHVILLTCKGHMYHTLNHSLFRATHKIVYVFCSALLRPLVRMQGLQDLSTLSKSLFHVTDNYSTVNYPYDFRNRALSCVKLILWTCSRGVSNRSVVTVRIWRRR